MIDSLYCFAKLNLVLKVFPKQKNGYHPIDSIFQSISLSDTLQIESCPGLKDHKITVNKVFIPNLNIRTLLDHSSLSILPKLAITLNKSIPMQSGLGGGSSNIAALLRYFYQQSWLKCNWKDIEEFALKFGADVPFFLRGGCCKVTGIGEKVISRPPMLLNTEYILIFPPFGMQTKSMYQALDDMRAYSHPDERQYNQNSIIVTLD